VKEYELFKASYCTLCHTLKNSFGMAARMTLNFDITFLAMLLSGNETPCDFCGKCCIVSPIKRKNIIKEPPKAFYSAAGCGVILAYNKLLDSISDDSGVKKLKSKLFAGLLKHDYKKAARAFPDFDQRVKELLNELSLIEKNREKSIDKAADTFAQILSATVDTAELKNKRILSELLYHVGRWIYVVDAYHDIEEDLFSGSYNPIIEKYGIRSMEDVTEEITLSIETTLNHSRSRISAAYELNEDTLWSGIIRNIIYIGMQDVFRKVKDGEYLPEENIR